MGSSINNKKNIRLAANLIALATLIVYLPALQNGFVNWDDNIMVYNNPYIRSISLQSWKWPGLDLWIPLTMFSFAFDYAVWGLNPFGYHLTNIIFHSINTLLIFFLVVRLTGFSQTYKLIFFTGGTGGHYTLIAGTLTYLLFGIHPLHVESVTWITERKDVLYSFFFLLSLLTYIKYVSMRSKRVKYYFISFIFFAFSLMSKPMAISLPIVFLILDIYPLKRLGIKEARAVLLEKIPFFLLCILFAVLTIWIHGLEKGDQSAEVYPLAGRIFLAIHVYKNYLIRMVLPFNLSPLYPLLSIPKVFSFEYIVSFIVMASTILFSICSLKRGKILFAIWFYYIFTLIPVLGHIDVQPEADRYTYLPSVGPFLLLGLGGGYLFEKYPRNKTVLVATVILLFGILTAKTMAQITVWKSSITLWSQVIRLFPSDPPEAYVNRGSAYLSMGDYQRAIRDLDAAIMLDPKFLKAYYNRGTAYGIIGENHRAINDLSTAIRLNPQYAEAYNNRGNAYRELGRYQEAIEDYNMAIKLNPRDAIAYKNRGIAHRKSGNNEEAMKDFEKADELSPR